MAGEWATSSLTEVSTDISYGYTESAADSPVGPRFLRITDIQGGTVNWNNVPYCPISQADHSKYRLKGGDIVIARTGNSTGENYIYNSDEDAVYASYLIRFRVNPSKACPQYVWYNLRSRRWWGFVNGSKTGSAQAGANAKVLGRFEFLLPPVPEQKAIAHILGSLDDKIDLNRKMNETLDAMARAIFKSWFVDFDPVRAKAEGRQPEGMDAETAKLFPDSFVESELGLIPKGWKVGIVGDFTTFHRQSITPQSQPNTIFHHYSLPAYDAGKRPELTEGEQIKSNKYIVPNDAVLISKLNPHIPRVWFPETSSTAKSISSTEFIVATGKNGFTQNTLYLFFTSPHFFAKFAGMVTGTTGSHQRVKPDSVLAMDAVIPESATIKRCSTLLSALFEQILVTRTTSDSLGKIRDALLPKLLSGQIRIRNAKSFLEEIA